MNISNAYGKFFFDNFNTRTPDGKDDVVMRQDIAVPAINTKDRATISDAAMRLYQERANDKQTEVEMNLERIKAKGPMERTLKEMEYLYAHDEVLASIEAKTKANPDYIPNSSEAEYEATAIGFDNFMPYLDTGEKKLYDQLAASGNLDAVMAMRHIAMTRMTFGSQAGGADGTTYDATNTKITPENIRKFFRFSHVDSTGIVDRQFAALTKYLEDNATPA